MGDDDDHDQDQDNEEGRKIMLTLTNQSLALLLNEIDVFNEAHKHDLDATEAMEMELEGEFCSLIKLMWFRGSCI